MYFPTNKTSHIESEQTIKTFEHLKEPIVITMPVYKNKHLFGNKNFAELLEMLGHIFVVIDIETDSVYDWIYRIQITMESFDLTETIYPI